MSTISHDRAARPVETGRTIFDYADELAVEVPTSCGRAGRCHECVVEVSRGMAALSAPSAAESFLRGDWRLACQAVIERDDIDISFAPLRRRPRILEDSDGEDAVPELDPAVRRHGDAVLYDGQVIDRWRGALYGLAVDLGTTTVVADFVDLESGRSVHRIGFENPQRFGGSDVMNRISYDTGPNRGELQQAAVTALNRELRRAAREHGIARQAVYEIVIAGNTTMRDILFGLDVASVGQKPYKSLVENDWRAGRRATTALTCEAWSLGLRANRRARVYGLPLIASHVGGDTAADLVATDFAALAEHSVVMLVDMGTNTEVVVGHRGRLVAASCPAGPAFEGGLVAYGMAAYDGAIERIELDPASGLFRYQTIADAPAQGLCGSGLIDLLAELRRHGRMTAKGVFADDRRKFLIEVVPERGITFSKADASALAQAKAANYCGQLIVLRTLGLDPGAVERLFLAGGFATYVDTANAIDIGLLAPVPEAAVVKVGNAALRGAREVLLSLPKRRRLEALVQRIEHVELETTPDFFDLFVDGCQFRPMPDVLTPPPQQRTAG
ncbi:MAG TPA: ASKHA domain-containing protein [Alphaproteobacteria bacterium]